MTTSSNQPLSKPLQAAVNDSLRLDTAYLRRDVKAALKQLYHQSLEELANAVNRAERAQRDSRPADDAPLVRDADS